mgnify:CR=1 FL=1
MTTIQTIAATTECNDVIPEQMNTELTILSGKFAGTCYAKGTRRFVPSRWNVR